MNTSELIQAIKVHGSFPTSNDLFSTDDFLSLFNHQLQIDITPLMLKLNEEFFLQSKDFEISPGGTYRIPTRAVGAKIRDLTYVDSGGNITNIPRCFEEDRASNKAGYYMLRNSVELSGGYASGTLRMKYFARPSKLVATTACAQVISLNALTGEVVVSSAPANFLNGSLVDFVQNNNPYDLLAMDSEISAISGTTLQFASLPQDLAVGDWICLAVESPVPMVPEELHPVLIQSSLCKTLSSKKDKQWENEMQVLAQNKQDAINMLDPRVENNSVKFRSGKLLGFLASRRY